MSQNILHMVAATRIGNASAIVGDRAALDSLRRALDDALKTGSGGTSLFSSDGEPHNIAVIFADDMYPVYTTYAFEAAPERSGRETMPINQLSNFSKAVEKSSGTPWESEAGRALAKSQTKQLIPSSI